MHVRDMPRMRRIGDVDQVIWYIFIFFQIFSGADIHTFIDLPGVDADDLAIELFCKFNCRIVKFFADMLATQGFINT